MGFKFRVLDANGVGLRPGDRVAWTASAGGRRKLVKRATIASIVVEDFQVNPEGRKVIVQADIDGGLKDSVTAFLEPLADSVTFPGITKI